MVPIFPNVVPAYVDAGGQWTETYTLTDNSGNPINLTGLTFTLVVRPTVTNLTEPALVSVNSTAPTSQGSITITPLTGVVAVVLTPAATTVLSAGVYPYGLWSSAGTSTATPWVTGNMTSQLIAIP